jgi:hypothetical protein
MKQQFGASEPLQNLFEGCGMRRLQVAAMAADLLTSRQLELPSLFK